MFYTRTRYTGLPSKDATSSAIKYFEGVLLCEYIAYTAYNIHLFIYSLYMHIYTALITYIYSIYSLYIKIYIAMQIFG